MLLHHILFIAMWLSETVLDRIFTLQIFFIQLNFKMNVGTVKIAEDKDFQVLKTYLSSCDDEWTLQYEKPNTKVWTKSPPQEQNISFKLIKVIYLLLVYMSMYIFLWRTYVKKKICFRLKQFFRMYLQKHCMTFLWIPNTAQGGISTWKRTMKLVI